MLTIGEDFAPLVASWFEDRGGVQVWRSLNLSAPDRSWITPLDAEKPTWQAGKPEIITDPSQVVVAVYEEVKRFHVAVRLSSTGMMYKLTDASNARLEKALKKAGEDATYRFDYETQEAVILRPAKKQTLAEWMQWRSQS